MFVKTTAQFDFVLIAFIRTLKKQNSDLPESVC